MDASTVLNPFVLGGVVRGDAFAGRAGEIATLRRLVQGGERTYLFAPRRYGKTSLIKEALDPAAEAGKLLLLWCDCLPTTGLDSLAVRIGEAVVRAARRGRLAEWIKTATGLFRRLRPTISAGPDGQVAIGLDLASGSSPAPGLEDAIEAVGRLARSTGKRTVLVLDEFQQITLWDNEHQAEATIRTVIQHQQGVAYVFAGSQRRLLQEMFADRARPLFQLAAPFPVGRLQPDELEPWLTQRFAGTGVKTAPAGIRLLIQLAAGHPWATQYLSHFVWNAAVSSRSAVTEDTVREGLAGALAVGATIYANDFAVLTAAQRSVLTAVATEPTRSPTSAEYLRRHQLPSKSTVNQAIRSLVEKGYLEFENGTYLSSDPLFAEWLRRQ